MSDSFSNKEIKTLLEMLAKHDVTECRIERGEDKLILKRGDTRQSQDERGAQSSAIHQVFGAYPGAPASAPSIPAGEQPQEIPRPQAPESAASNGATAAEQAESDAVALTKELTSVASPMVGTFYRRPAVDAEPYVNVGDNVKKGQVLCIVEAMKLMNEIECEFSGKVAEVCLEDGQMVEYGEVLFRIEPN
jgi:acetyl-CoA carboxylase biotin carboxyl carrier protein